MTDLISKSALVEQLSDAAVNAKAIEESSCANATTYYAGIKCGFFNAAIIADNFPTVDAVPVGAYEQTRWERDMAISQLAEIGKSLFEKMDDVATVVRCKDCKRHNAKAGKLYRCDLRNVWQDGDFFCANGERSEDD